MNPKRKLIEVALPLETISRESAREKSIRHGHPSTLHLWWARRPLAAARAVLWASLVDDPSAHPGKFPTVEDQRMERKRLFDILERLVRWENSNDQDILDESKVEMKSSCGDDLPNVLDPFCGGGTIPLEAQRLGLSAYGGDLNPVPVLITKAMVEIPHRFAGRPPVNPVSRSELGSKVWERAQGLAADIRYYGEWMRERAWERIGHLYLKVDGKTVIAWLWARTVQSPDPSWKGHSPLLKSGVLRNKPGKPVVWVEPIVDRDTQTVTYQVRVGGTPSGGTITRGGGVCVATGAPITLDYVREQGQRGLIGQVCVSAVVEGSSGCEYVVSPIMPDVPEPRWIPSGKLQGKAAANVHLYGITEWADLFTVRQLVALTTFSDLLSEVREMVERDARSMSRFDDGTRLRDGGLGVAAYADALVTYLAFVVDRCADYWSSVCSWNNSREILRGTFGRQAIAMIWDYAEGNPFSESTGNWLGQVDWIAKAVANLPASDIGEVLQGDAVTRLVEVERPLICTDPPHYDNIQYADISDFFYVWLRHNLSGVWPEECATLQTPKKEEMVYNTWRAGSQDAAREYFESGMSAVMEQIAHNQHAGFPATIFCAFKQQDVKSVKTASTGWEMLQGLVDAGLEVTATWPIRTEMANRVVAKGAVALSSSVVLACRPRSVDARLETRGGFLGALRQELPEAVRLLQEQAIPPVDMAQSAMGPGMRVFSRYRRVVEADGSTMRVRTALTLINGVLEEILSATAEAALDSDSRFALTWYRQFGHQPGPLGEAEMLAKAMNTSVSGVVDAGVAESKGGQVRLLTRDELDLERDRQLTVWELIQHLVARQVVSDAQAGWLLAQAEPGLGDQARHLAYLLYEVANGAGRTEDAVAYNALLVSWNHLLQYAHEASAPYLFG